MSLPEKKIDKHTNLSLADPETERRKRDVYRSDVEKFQLLAQMLRRNVLYKKAKISHK